MTLSILFWIIFMTSINGLIAFSGALSLFLSNKNLKKITIFFVSFSIGALLGGAFFHFIPEALEKLSIIKTTLLILAGILIFFIAEKILHWHNCHDGKCEHVY